MDIWTQITTYPVLWLAPMTVGAALTSVASLWVGWRNRTAGSADVDRKIAAERAVTRDNIASESALLEAKLAHEVAGRLSDQAWADYGLRRDLYLDLAKQIDYLFNDDADEKARVEFLRTVQKIRLIGSDEVVIAINNLTSSIRDRFPEEERTVCYAALMNALRQDIRRLNTMPAVGTRLDACAFPIEV